jgi:anti-sigma factor RsiW
VTCQEFIGFLMSYLAGELPAEERAVFDEHLGECPACVNYLKSYEEAVRLGQAVCRCPDDAVPDDVPETLVQAILAARRRERV